MEASSVTETDLSREIKEALFQCSATYKIQFDYMRLESHATIQGLPDANLCVQSKEGFYAPEIWLELKIGDNKPSALQIGFARRRWELGQHNIYCIRGRETKGVVVALVESMNQYWNSYPATAACMTMDSLAYFLLTGEEYRE
jgi:hypothetical protein